MKGLILIMSLLDYVGMDSWMGCVVLEHLFTWLLYLQFLFYRFAIERTGVARPEQRKRMNKLKEKDPLMYRVLVKEKDA